MNTLLLTLFIFNIPIKRIDFAGNSSISKGELLSAIRTKKGEPFNELNLVSDVKQLLGFYNSKGFFKTVVHYEFKESPLGIDLIFVIEEGPRPKIEKIVVGDDNDAEIRNLIELHAGDFFIGPKIINAETKIEDHYKDLGYAFAEVSSRIDADSGILTFDIKKGEQYYIRSIKLKGLKSCKPQVVLREIELKVGDRYSQAKIRNSRRRIYGLGFFDTVDIEFLKGETDSLDLIFAMRELKSRLLNFGVGLCIPLSFLISLSVEELNLFNAGHRFQIRPSFKINMKQEFETKIESRYVLSHLTPAKLSVSVLPFYWFEEKEEFRRKTKGGELRVSKIYTENIQANIAQKYKLVGIESKSVSPETLARVTNSLGLEIMFDYRDQFFNPQQGIYLVPRVEYAGGLLGGSNHFLRLEIEERLFHPLFRNILGQRLKCGFLIPTNGIALDAKYYLGGQYSLRGYPEKSLGPDSLAREKYGNLLFNLNLEYRLRLPKNFGLVTFCDAGYVHNVIDFKQTDYLKTSAGFGLRYNTPIGPVRADIGFPLTEKGAEYYLGIYHIF